jgi:3-hydroxyisobutyrate dehydrogenase
MQVGWIGLGAMGAPMAARVAAGGHRVAGFDVDQARAAALASAGVTAVESAAHAARGAEVLVVMVATPDQGQAALFGSGAADALPAGATVVIMATVGPDAVTAWAGELSARGLRLVDAPVSGGTARAGTGELTVMASGPPEAVDAARPVLSVLGAQLSVVGPNPGDGQRVKLVNQLLCGVHIAAAAEALAFAEAQGLDPAACWEVIRHGAAASFMLDDRGARMLQPGGDVRSALDIFVKDMGLVVGAARERDFATPLAQAAERLYQAGSAAGLGRSDDSTVIEVLRGRG